MHSDPIFLITVARRSGPLDRIFRHAHCETSIGNLHRAYDRCLALLELCLFHAQSFEVKAHQALRVEDCKGDEPPICVTLKTTVRRDEAVALGFNFRCRQFDFCRMSLLAFDFQPCV
jgi:hypothetical protein